VIFAFLIGATGKQNLAVLVGEGFATPSIVIGGVVFAATVIVLYRWIIRMARTAA
jgi:hypothetical protein